VIITLSGLGSQGALVIVQVNVAVDPEFNVTVVVGEDEEAILTSPETTDQLPVPTVAVFAAIVKVVLVHCEISGPAAAVVGLLATVIFTSSNTGEHPAAVMVQRNTYAPVAALNVEVGLFAVLFSLPNVPDPPL
jgi:hypothetical protein